MYRYAVKIQRKQSTIPQTVLATILLAKATLLWKVFPPGKRKSLPDVAWFIAVQEEHTTARMAMSKLGVPHSAKAMQSLGTRRMVGQLVNLTRFHPM